MGRGRGRGGDDSLPPLALGCCGLFFFIGIVLLGTSFDVLKPTHAGIRWNPTFYRMQYSDGVYKNGRHILAPGHKFKSYSLKLRTMNWDRLTVWSKDKQTIDLLPFTVFMRINGDEIIDIHKKYGGGKNANPVTPGPWSYWENLVLMTTKQITKEYYVKEFFEDRKAIEEDIRVAIVQAFQDEHVKDISVHFGSVDIPDGLKEALVTKVVTQQQKITTEKQREIARVEADTTVISAKADSTVTIIGAKATAEATKLVQFAEADAYELQQNSYANGYKDIASSLVFSGDQLLRYIWARSISGAGTNKDLIVALDGTTIKTES